MRQPPTFNELHTARPYREWRAAYGDVLWWLLPHNRELPFCGVPWMTDWPYQVYQQDHLWWTPLPDVNLIQERWNPRKEPTE